jgi:flagellar biosynthesis/type III secretory pathway protein FliH
MNNQMNGANNKKKQACSDLDLEVAKMIESEAAAREALERQYVLGMMEDGFQEGYKMGLQDGWSRGFDDGFQEGYQEAVRHFKQDER